MTSLVSVLRDVYDSQSRISQLTKSQLNVAAEVVNSWASRESLVLHAIDPTGERILGTVQSSYSTHASFIDMTRRLDGQRILLVTGAIAGPAGLIQSAYICRSLGASEVHAAVLEGNLHGFSGCESVRFVFKRENKFPRETHTLSAQDSIRADF